MKDVRFALLGLAALLAAVPAARAQQLLHIGYVYPAGGKQGTEFEAIVGGQFLTGASDVHVTGGGVEAKIVELIKPISGAELNRLRIQIDELLARKAVAQKDFRALEKFRSFKSAKNVKSDEAAHDRELAALKKKYANASWTAEDEKLLREVRMKLNKSVRRPANPAISELLVVQVSVAPEAEPGQRELRVGAPTGLSNPLTFCVGQLPEFSEKTSKTITQQKSAVARTAIAPKGRKADADMEITLPAVVNGQIMPGQVNRYRFTASKGQRLVVAASARELIPYLPDAVPGWFQAALSLYDAKGNELAYADHYRFRPDPVLLYEIPQDGQYVIEIRDSIYRGREDFVYRIAVGELPFVTGIFPLGGRVGKETTVMLQGWNLPLTSLTEDNEHRKPGVYPISVRKGDQVSNHLPFAVDTLPEGMEKEPNDEPSTAQPVTIPLVVNGRIDRPGDWDVFSFEGRADEEVVAEVYARRLDSPLDSVLKLADASGRQLALNDDHEDKGAGLMTHHADSWLRAKLPADGTYYLFLGDAQHQGGPEYAYRLRISPPRLDYELRVVPSSINARPGTTLPITVYAVRRDGFSGEIALKLKNAPPGFVLSGNRVPAGQDQVRLTLTVPPTPQKEPFILQVEGRAKIRGRDIARQAVPADDMMQAFAYRHLVPADDLEVAVGGRAIGRGPVRILSKTPLKIHAGATARIEIGVPPALLDRVHFELSDPPEGIAIESVSPGTLGTEIVLKTDGAKVKPGLKGNLIVAAYPKGPAAGKAKQKAMRRAAPLTTLPAIPFEIVGR